MASLRATDQRERVRKRALLTNIFYKLIPEVTHHFCHILLVTQTNSGTMWEITQEYEYQEVVITGERFEDGYHSLLSGSQ